jgi:hypothetical protein
MQAVADAARTQTAPGSRRCREDTGRNPLRPSVTATSCAPTCEPALNARPTHTETKWLSSAPGPATATVE